MNYRVGAFTDTYLPTVNGVTYTVKSWRDRWCANGGSMDVVFPRANGYEPTQGEYPVESIPFPFYKGYRLGMPSIPAAVGDVDIVHAHTPFSLGLAAYRTVKSTGCPFVVSYHTPCSEYTAYLSSIDRVETTLSNISRRYERWFFDRADAIVAPTETAATYLNDTLEISSPVRIVPNGVDLDRFSPQDGQPFRDQYELPGGPLIGYTGRHGHEKRLPSLLKAVAGGPDDWTLVLAGAGPATPDLKAMARDLGVSASFLGFLDRAELPEFYSAIDLFAFPSPIETQGLVALESMACGTPVVAIEAGALIETVDDGITGYHFTPGDIGDFTETIRRGLDDRSSLEGGCLAQRESIGLDHSIGSLTRVYDSLLENGR